MCVDSTSPWLVEVAGQRQKAECWQEGGCKKGWRGAAAERRWSIVHQPTDSQTVGGHKLLKHRELYWTISFSVGQAKLSCQVTMLVCIATLPISMLSAVCGDVYHFRRNKYKYIQLLNYCFKFLKDAKKPLKIFKLILEKKTRTQPVTIHSETDCPVPDNVYKLNAAMKKLNRS